LKKIGEGKMSLLKEKQRQTDFNLLISLCQENFLEFFRKGAKEAKKTSIILPLLPAPLREITINTAS